jgi:hypothetical protein
MRTAVAGFKTVAQANALTDISLMADFVRDNY